jgi:hypothetical protein
MISTWFWNVLTAISQMTNTLFGGYPDEMLSARAHRCKWQWREWLINQIFRWDRDSNGKLNHCEQAYWHEVHRLDSPEEYRKCRECFNKEGV